MEAKVKDERKRYFTFTNMKQSPALPPPPAPARVFLSRDHESTDKEPPTANNSSIITSDVRPKMNPFANGFPLKKLKPRKLVKPKALFEDLPVNADNYEWKTPKEMMLGIDEHCKHRVTEQEKEELNLTTERLNINGFVNMLDACGSRKGRRFTTLQIQFLRELSSRMEKLYTEVNQQYNQLPKSTQNTPFGDEKEKFQQLGESYVELMIKLRVFIHDTAKSVQAEEKLAVAQDADGLKSSATSKYPQFLLTLSRKYRQSHSLGSSIPSPSKKPIDSIAKFCIFLTETLYNQLTMEQRVMDAFAELLDAAKLRFHYDHESRCLQLTPRIPSSTFQRVIFKFLRSLKELSTIRQDMDLLSKNTRHINSS